MSIYEAADSAAPMSGAPASDLSNPKMLATESPIEKCTSCLASACTSIVDFVKEGMAGFQSVDAFQTNKKSWVLLAILAVIVLCCVFSDKVETEWQWVESTLGFGAAVSSRVDRFVLVDRPMTWTHAKEYCRTHYHDLASIHSADENKQVHEMCEGSKPTTNCWIGLHQPAGASLTDAKGNLKEIVAFDNRGKCNVDHRISHDLLDIPISSIRVIRVDGTTAQFYMSKTTANKFGTIRDWLLKNWDTVDGGNDQYKRIAGNKQASSKQNDLYLFSDGDIITDGMFDDVPVCPQAHLAHNEEGMYTQDTCAGTPNGLFSMAPPNSLGIFDQLLADSGECTYNHNWGWVVQAMWVTPDRTQVQSGNSGNLWKEMYRWTDGSNIDYKNWPVGQPNVGAEVQFTYKGLWESASGSKTKRLNIDIHGVIQPADLSTKPGQPFVCEKTGPRYSLVDTPMTWSAARAYCKEYYSDLATITSEEDQQDAQNACKERSGGSPCVDGYTTYSQCQGSLGCWIGLRADPTKHKLGWSDGTNYTGKVNYTNWDKSTTPPQPTTASKSFATEALLRMSCDMGSCPHGEWVLHNGRTRTQRHSGQDPLMANESPFLCQGSSRGGGGPARAIESSCSSSSGGNDPNKGR